MRWLAMTGAGIALLLLSACTATPTSTPNSTPSAFTGPPVPVATTGLPGVGAGGDPSAGYNTVDLVFLQQMIPHHQLALRLLAMATNHGASPAVQRIAATEQTPLPIEVAQMIRSLQSLGLQPSTGPTGSVLGNAGSVSENDLTRLGAKSGTDFDTYFAYLLNRHSQGSVQLAQGEAAQGFNTGTRALATGIAQRDSDVMATLSKLAG